MSKPPKRRSRLMLISGMLALIAMSVAVTWVASGSIRSPAEAAARTLPPEPSPILVPVESKVISSDIVTRGTGRFGSPQTLTLAPTELKTSSGFVDITPVVGDQASEGDVILVHSGRPVILLQGAQPVYRDLGPGMSGNDILQLEQALDRLGFSPGIIDGNYDDATQLAVVAWYADLGFAPFTATQSQLDAIRTVQADLDALEREVVAADETLATVEGELAAARSAHQAASTAVTTATTALATARSEAEVAVAAAQADADIAALAAEQAWILLPAQWDSPEHEQTTLFELENLRAVAAAAQANVEQSRVNGEASVQAAEAAVTVATGELAAAAAAVRSAESRTAVAVRATEAVAAPAAQLEQNFTTAKALAGAQVPADEIVFVPQAPVRIAEIHVPRGSAVDGPLVSVTNAVVAIDGALALDQAGLVEAGTAVTISEPDLGIDASGEVSFVAAGPGTRGADGFHVYFETLVTKSITPSANISGASVRLTIGVESSGGAVLAVPASAVTLTVDGSSQILVERSGQLQPINVDPGLAAAGFVQITPTSDTIKEDELVVVGFEQRGPTNG